MELEQNESANSASALGRESKRPNKTGKQEPGRLPGLRKEAQPAESLALRRGNTQTHMQPRLGTEQAWEKSMEQRLPEQASTLPYA